MSKYAWTFLVMRPKPRELDRVMIYHHGELEAMT
jgi:hypothetical protein